MPKVSVIVPVYNTEIYLKKCLDSLVNQTLKEIEIIVVNDGSPDESQKIIDVYTKEYPQKVKAFIKENGGLSDARNYGMAHSSGEYIGFVDSDDYVEEDMFELLYKKAVRDRCDMVDSSYFIETETSSKVVGRLPEHLKKGDYIQKFTVCFCTKLVHRSILEGIGDIPKIWHEDVAYMPVVASYAKKIGFVDKPLYHYYTREGSISNSFFDNKVRDMVKAADFAVHMCNPEYKVEVTVLLFKLLDRNVSHRWVYAGDFIEKIREWEEFAYSSGLTKRYPELAKGLQKYWDLTEGSVPKLFYINGFGSEEHKEQKEMLSECGFYDGGTVVVLNESNCNVLQPKIARYYEEGDYQLIASYFALQRIVEGGGIYISSHMQVDVPMNSLLPYDAFFVYAGKEMFSDELFGGKKGSPSLSAMLERAESALERGERPELGKIAAACLDELYGIPFDGCTRLLEDKIALLRPEAAYWYSEKLDKMGKNAMHFCHYQDDAKQDMVSVPRSVFEYHFEKSIDSFLSKTERWRLIKDRKTLQNQISEYENSTIWKMTKPLRKLLDEAKRIKRKIYPELKADYRELIKTRKQMQEQYAFPKNLLEEYSTKDCIEDYSVLIQFKNKLEAAGYQTNCPLYTADPGSYYGIQNDMLSYAGIPPEKEKIKDYALIEHGAHFQNIAPFGGEGKRRYTGYITLGDFRKKFLQEKYRLPVYTVGPYIAYAEQYYDEELLKKKKEEWGRTLLIFYAHNHEWLHKVYEDNDFIRFIKEQQSQFDTLALCCYWADLEEDYVHAFEEMGVKIVTSGFRSDCNFMRRQKSLLTLADAVLTNDIGSHVGYSIYMNKPLTYYETKVTEQESRERLTDKAVWLIEKNKKEIAKCFLPKEGKLYEKITLQQKEVCMFYFGLEYVRTPEEMKAIFSLAREIYEKSDKHIGSYGKAAETLRKMLKASKDEEGKTKGYILDESLK